MAKEANFEMFQLFEKLPIVFFFFNRKEFKDLINLKSNLFIARLNSFSLWELSVCATIQCVVWLIKNFCHLKFVQLLACLA